MTISSPALILICALALALALFLGLFLGMRGLKNSLAARLTDMEKVRRRQYADLLERIEHSNERMNHDLQMITQLMQINAQSNENLKLFYHLAFRLKTFD